VIDIFACLFYGYYTHNQIHKNHQCVQQFDIAIIFNYGLNENETQSLENLSRLQKGLTLYESEKVKKLMVVGGNRGFTKFSHSQKMAQWLIQKGVPIEKIFIAPCSYDTASNLENAVNLMRQHHIQSAICVSNALHLARIQQFAKVLNLDNLSYCPSNLKVSLLSSYIGIHIDWATIIVFSLLDKETYLNLLRKYRGADISHCV